MTYKDRCWCINTDCKKYDICKETFDYAKKEQAKSKDAFVREMLFATAKFTKCEVK